MTSLPTQSGRHHTQNVWRLSGLLLAVHFLLACAGHALRVPPAQAPWLWPAAGFLPTMLAFMPRQHWPAPIAAAVSAEILALWLATSTTPDAGAVMVIAGNMLEAVVGALMVILLLPQPWYRRTSVEIMAYVCVAAILTPLIGAALNFSVTLMATDSFAVASNVFSAWWASDVLGIVLVSPLIGGAMLATSVRGSTRWHHLATAGAVMALWLASVVWLIGRPAGPPASFAAMPPSVLSFVVLSLSLTCALILALRVPPLLTAAGSLIMALTLNIFASVVHSPVGHLLFHSTSAPHAAHLIFIAAAVCSFLVSLVRFENRHAKRLGILRHSPDRVIADIATRLGSCSADSADECIAECLERLGRVCGADRCVVMEFDRRGDTFSQTYRWHRTGVTDSKTTMQKQPVAAVSDTLKDTEECGSLYLRLEDVAPNGGQYLYMRAVGAAAVAYAPLRRTDGITGVVGLTWLKPTRRWTRDTSVLLQSTAQVLGSTLMRVEAQRNDESYRSRLRELTAQMISLDDKVRRDTAADLHDGAAQSLAVARLRLAQIQRHTAPSPGTLGAVEEMIVTAVAEIRSVIRRMIPSELYELGLVYALRQFVTDAQEQHDLDFIITVDGEIDQLSDHVAGLVYRSCRELVINAIRHTHTQRIAIHLHQSADLLHLEVCDDGQGFVARRSGQREADATRLGLFSLRERFRAIGGDISMRSDHNGTRVEITVPRSKTLVSFEHTSAL